MTQDRVQNIHRELIRLADKQIAEHSRRFFKTGKGEYGHGDRFLGIRVPALRKLARQYRGVEIEEVSQMLKSEFHEERLLALLMMVYLFKKANDESRSAIYNLYLENTRFINNWDLVDCSAEHIIGEYLLVGDKKPLYKLAVSDMLWERRISIMSTFDFIKHGEFTDTLKIAGILLLDKEDLIHKAVGWMLREVGKRNIQIEEKFLKKYHGQMPRTMLRYAIERFPEPKRKRYLSGNV